MKTMKIFSLLLLATCACLLATPALAKDAAISWLPSLDPAVIGYRIYYKAENPTPPYEGTEAEEGPSPVDVGNVTTATLHFRDDAKIYYYAVTAYDASSNESDYAIFGSSDWAPVAIAPLNNATAGTANFRFIWTDPPSGFSGTYTLHYSPDPNFAGTPPPGTGGGVNLPSPPALPVVAIFLLLLTTLAFTRRAAPRRALVPLALSLCLASCGGGGGGGGAEVGAIITPGTGGTPQTPGDSTATQGDTPTDPTQPEPPPVPGTRIVSGLQAPYFEANDLVPGIVYYWKVVAHNGATDHQSVTYTFTAQ